MATSATARPQRELITPVDVLVDYRIPETTQAVWRCTNRYGFRDLVIKVGRSVRYRRDDFESWLESRRQVVDDERQSLPAKEVA